MRTFLALSRTHPEAGADAARRARAAFRVLDGAAPVHQLRRGHDEVFLGAPEPGDLVQADGVLSVLLLHTSYTTAGERLDGASLLRRVRHDPAPTLRTIAPPFAAAWRATPDAPLALTTDNCGLRHVYRWQGEGWAAVSTSSVLLAWVVGAPLDEEAMGELALVGNHVLEHTPFAGVRKLDAGTLCRLAGGRVTTEVFEPQLADAPFGSGGRAGQAARGVTVLRDAVGAALDAYPDAGLELSGGFDSRAVLAAIPKAARRGRYALTLGTPGNADIRIATGLAEREGLVHQVVDLTGLESLSGEEVLGFARGAARRRDCTANPMGTGVLDWIEAQIDQVPRFNGQNSEFGRAHLYPGQRRQSELTDARIDRLATWRIMQNHSTDPAVLDPTFREAGRQAALRSLRTQMRSFGVDWTRTLDEYYFLSRMQRWAGVDYTAAGYDRTILSPFFQPGYLAWVRACHPHDRRASRVFAAMFDLLDPELAALPLHLGISPHDVAVGGPRVAAKRAVLGGAMTTAKVWQRVRRVGRGSSGADRFAELVVDAWRTTEDPRPRLDRYAFVDLDGVGAVIDGSVTVSSASIAFLVDLEVLTDLHAQLDAALATEPPTTLLDLGTVPGASEGDLGTVPGASVAEAAGARVG